MLAYQYRHTQKSNIDHRTVQIPSSWTKPSVLQDHSDHSKHVARIDALLKDDALRCHATPYLAIRYTPLNMKDPTLTVQRLPKKPRSIYLAMPTWPLPKDNVLLEPMYCQVGLPDAM